jgi:hypothetical protein
MRAQLNAEVTCLADNDLPSKMMSSQICVVLGGVYPRVECLVARPRSIDGHVVDLAALAFAIPLGSDGHLTLRRANRCTEVWSDSSSYMSRCGRASASRK